MALTPPKVVYPATDLVRQEISPDDAMFSGDTRHHYFSTGESALRVIMAAISLAQIDPPRKILDFGAGAGRVTRWLLPAFADAQIHACDVRDSDMLFLRQTFGINAWTIIPDPNQATIPEQYDVIWVGSVITHLPASGTRQLIDKLIARLEPNGLVLLSFHGKRAIEYAESGNINYMHDEGWQAVRKGYFADGYGYADYLNQSGYGISANTPSWMLNLVEGIPATRLVLLSAHAWDDHHDVVAIQRLVST